MDFQKAFEILSKDIEEIENILAGYEKSDAGDKVTLKLALSKLSNLRQNFLIMSETAGKTEINDREEFPQENIQTEAEAGSGVKHEENEQVNDETQEPKALEKETETVETEVPEPAMEKPGGKNKVKPVLSDRFQSQKFRNETLAKKQSGKKLSAKLQEQPIKDIYKSIALNERFQYIKELFGGNGEKFNDTIRYLNQVKTFDEAERYIQENFAWDPENELVIRLYHLVERKLKTS